MLSPAQPKVLDKSDCLKRPIENQLSEQVEGESQSDCPESVAHELNNLLTIIIGNCDLLITEHGLNQISAECADEIKKAAERAADLANQLITLKHEDDWDPTFVEPD